MSNHIADAWVLGINPARYEALTDAHKTALQEAAVETEAWKAENDAADIAASIETLKKNGMEVNELTAEAAQAFRRRAQKLYPTFAGLVKDQAFFDRTSPSSARNNSSRAPTLL